MRSDQGAARKQKNEDIICKKCPTCNIIKTPRSFHCKFCDVCVAVHDHHCPWVGSCVGQRNHKMFTIYNFITFFLSIYTFSLNIAIIANC